MKTEDNRFECCFEQEFKGMFFEVEDNHDSISFTMYNGFTPETQVCLRAYDIDRLIGLLQKLQANKA